jgi:hypothetical protein
MVSLTHRPLYTGVKNPQPPPPPEGVWTPDPTSRFDVVQKRFLFVLGMEPRFLSRLVPVPTELHSLQFLGTLPFTLDGIFVVTFPSPTKFLSSNVIPFRIGWDWGSLVETGAAWLRLGQIGWDWGRLVETGADWLRLGQIPSINSPRRHKLKASVSVWHVFVIRGALLVKFQRWSSRWWRHYSSILLRTFQRNVLHIRDFRVEGIVTVNGSVGLLRNVCKTAQCQNLK